MRIFVATTKSSTSLVDDPVAVTCEASGASGLRAGDREVIVEAAVDLQLGDRAQCRN